MSRPCSDNAARIELVVEGTSTCTVASVPGCVTGTRPLTDSTRAGSAGSTRLRCHRRQRAIDTTRISSEAGWSNSRAIRQAHEMDWLADAGLGLAYDRLRLDRTTQGWIDAGALLRDEIVDQLVAGAAGVEHIGSSWLRARAPNPRNPREGQQARHHPIVPRTARTIDLAVGERCEGLILRRRDGQRLDRRTAHRWVKQSASEPDSATATRTCCAQRSSWPHSTPGSRCVTCRSPLVTPTLARPRSNGRRRQNFDRHAAYVVVAFVASG